VPSEEAPWPPGRRPLCAAGPAFLESAELSGEGSRWWPCFAGRRDREGVRPCQAEHDSPLCLPRTLRSGQKPNASSKFPPLALPPAARAAQLCRGQIAAASVTPPGPRPEPPRPPSPPRPPADTIHSALADRRCPSSLIPNGPVGLTPLLGPATPPWDFQADAPPSSLAPVPQAPSLPPAPCCP